MKIKLLAMALLANLCFSGAAFAACTPPDEPAVPDGTTATGADMLKAKKAVEAYMEEAENYLNCGLANVQHNRMIKEMERVADKFNNELRAYKAKS